MASHDDDDTRNPFRDPDDEPDLSGDEPGEFCLPPSLRDPADTEATAVSGRSQALQPSYRFATLGSRPLTTNQKIEAAASGWLEALDMHHRLGQFSDTDPRIEEWRTRLRRLTEAYEKLEPGDGESGAKSWKRVRNEFETMSSKTDRLIASDPRKAAKSMSESLVLYDTMKQSLGRSTRL